MVFNKVFLQHSWLIIASKIPGDVEAYLVRLSEIGGIFDRLIEALKIREAKGIIPPKFIINYVIAEMKAFIEGQDVPIDEQSEVPALLSSNLLFTNLATKIDSIKALAAAEKKHYLNEAVRIYSKYSIRSL